MMRFGLSAIVVLSLVVASSAQSDTPTFEVASVKRAPPDRGPFGYTPAPHPPRALSSGQFDATATLRILIGWAYHPGVPLEGSFKALDDIFVIAAKAPGPVLLARPDEVGPMNRMLQSLLADRFKLRVRWESRNFPVYALRRTSTDHLGPNLKRTDATCPPGYPESVKAAPAGCFSVLSIGKGQVKGTGTRMTDFAKFLTMVAGRRVVDDTGLAGSFDVTTAFDPRSESDDSRFPAENLPALRDALRDDLGLKLESGRRDLPVLIVEHVEQPTGN
jgi:uncharacterized protein (TIGR03435 family)